MTQVATITMEMDHRDQIGTKAFDGFNAAVTVEHTR